MTTTYSIRPATPDDIAALSRLRIELFQELGELQDSAAAAGLRALTEHAYSDGLAKKTCLAWLAEAPDATAVGTATFQLFPKLPSPANPMPIEGYLLGVFVVPEWRRRGIASALVAGVIQSARHRGIHRIRLHTTPAGRRTYQRAGFEARLNEMELLL
jgi:GNAT superfamily N-acetyltransferase